MPIGKGTTNIDGVFKGTTEIGSVYKGTTLVYENYKTLTAEGVPPLTLNKCKNTNMLGYQIYGDSTQQILPDGYTQLEYIESTGTQYIDTGVKVSTNNKMVMDLQFTDSSTTQINGGYYIYKDGNTNYSTRNDIGVSGTTGTFFMGASSTSISSGVTADTKRHTFMIDATTGNWSIDNTSGNVTPNTHADSVSYILIGARGGANVSGVLQNPSNYCEEKIYNVKIYTSNILVRNFIPCKNSSNVVGMYDTVNNQFYTNAGTGTFTAGAVAPTPEAPIEIESVGDKTKNLFDKTNAVIYPAYINVNNNYVGGTAESKSITISCKPNTTYTISHNTNNIALFRACYINSEMPDIGRTVVAYDVKNDTTDSRELKVTTGNQCKYVVVQVPYSMYDTVKETLQIEVGSTATAYEQYGYKIPVIVQQGNLFDKTTGVDNEHFIVAATGELSSTTGTGALDTYACTFPIKVEPNTTYIKSGSIGAGITRFEDAEHNNIGHGSYLTSFTTPAGCYYVLFNLLRTNAPYNDVELKKEPTTTNIYLDAPLRKIGDGIATKLPSGYTQLEYIESTGTQYIDTGYKPNNNTRMTAHIKIETLPTSYVSVFGARNGNNDQFFVGVNYAGLYFFTKYATQDSTTNLYDYNIPIVGTHNIDFNKNYIDIDNKKNYTFTQSTFTSNYNAYIFGVNNADSATQLISAKLYSCKIYDNGVLVRDFIPAKNSSNVIGMYDLVNDVFYTNQGTGDFVAGAVVYSDYIDLETQKVYRNVGEIVFNGYEDWQSITSNILRVKLSNDRIVDAPTTLDYLNQLCNYLPTNLITTANTEKGCDIYYSLSLGGSYFRLRYDDFTDITTWKNFLRQCVSNKNPVKHYYQSATTTEESITLPDILLNKGTNVVSVGTSLNASNMWIKYKGKN